MDAKVTLSFDKSVIEKAKAYAEQNHTSLSRLTEYLLRKITEKPYAGLDDLPISSWVSEVAEGKAEYKKRGKSSVKKDYYESRK